MVYVGDWMEFKIVISNKEKTFQKEIKDEQARNLLGLKIGDVFDGRLIGEPHQLRITGGSDKEGFPMRKDVEGTRRLLLLLDGGQGFNPLRKGERRKKRVRGNTISEAIVQINTVVVEEKKEEPKLEVEAKPEEEEGMKPEEEKPKKRVTRKKEPSEKKKPAKRKTTKK